MLILVFFSIWPLPTPNAAVFSHSYDIVVVEYVPGPERRDGRLDNSFIISSRLSCVKMVPSSAEKKQFSKCNKTIFQAIKKA